MLLEGENVLRVWWIVSAMLVLLMQIGFVCLEMSCVKDASRPGIAVKNFMMLIVSSLVFTLIGVRLMYGADVHGVIGWGPAQLELNPGSYGWLFFQTGFAAVAATILSGALAGRTTLFSNVALAFLMALVIYPVYGHWMWTDEGWLTEARDFAGSGVVHFLGGFTAFVAAKMAGPRAGFLKNGVPQDLVPRSLPFASIAVILLWVGWIGFNGGSVLPTDLNNVGFGSIGHAVLATCCAASGGGIATMVIAGLYHWRIGRGAKLKLGEAFRQKLLFDPWATLGGTMGGMVAITANCNWLFSEYGAGFLWMATIFGVVGGIAAFVTGLLVRNVAKVDDPVEAVAVHAGGGAAGILLGVLHPGTSLGIQALALAAAITWVLVTVYPCLLLLRSLGLLHVSMAEEENGLTFESYEAAVLTSDIIERRRRESAHSSTGH